jgi:hypothetical protein
MALKHNCAIKAADFEEACAEADRSKMASLIFCGMNLYKMPAKHFTALQPLLIGNNLRKLSFTQTFLSDAQVKVLADVLGKSAGRLMRLRFCCSDNRSLSPVLQKIVKTSGLEEFVCTYDDSVVSEGGVFYYQLVTAAMSSPTLTKLVLPWTTVAFDLMGVSTYPNLQKAIEARTTPQPLRCVFEGLVTYAALLGEFASVPTRAEDDINNMD